MYYLGEINLKLKTQNIFNTITLTISILLKVQVSENYFGFSIVVWFLCLMACQYLLVI